MANIKVTNLQPSKILFHELFNLELANIVGGNSFEKLNFLHDCGGVRVPPYVKVPPPPDYDERVRIPKFDRSPWLIL